MWGRTEIVEEMYYNYNEDNRHCFVEGGCVDSNRNLVVIKYVRDSNKQLCPKPQMPIYGGVELADVEK